MIKAVKFVSIPVRDQDKALEFYTGKLGLSIVTDQPYDEKQRWLELSINGADTRIVLFTTDADRERIGTFSNIAFTSDNVEKTWRELSAKGVEFVAPPRKEEWGTFVMFKDLDGNQFVISSRS